MGAKHILLNHFSQRYPKIPVLPDSQPGQDGPTIAISFDFMSIRVGDMWKMAHYIKPISILVAGAEPEEGDNTSHAVETDTNPTTDQPNGTLGASSKPDSLGKRSCSRSGAVPRKGEKKSKS